eukprot:9015830-Pyramimonas_sp.AAC.1
MCRREGELSPVRERVFPRSLARRTSPQNQPQEERQYIPRVRTNRRRGGRGEALYTQCENQSQEATSFRTTRDAGRTRVAFADDADTRSD